jgi:hypothetical protein
VDFLPPSVVAFTQRWGEAETAVATEATPTVNATCASPLPAGTACQMMLHFSSALRPGTYAIDVGVAGAWGGWSQRTEIVRVRATPLLAFLAIVIGAGAGWYINTWRSIGRWALSGLIEATRLKDRLQFLVADPSDAETARLLAHATERIDEIQAQLRKGVDPASDLTAFAVHLGRLADAVAIGRGMAKLSPAGQDALRLRWTALIGQLGDAGMAGSSLDILLRSLAADVSAWPGLANRAAAANVLAVAVESLQRAGGTDLPASAVEVAALRKAGSDALIVFDPEKPTDTVAARDASLVVRLGAARIIASDLVVAAATALSERARVLENSGVPLPAEQSMRAKKVAADAVALARVWTRSAPEGDDGSQRDG